MAILRTIHCTVCGETKRESRANNDYSNICRECKRKQSNQERREFLAGRAGLTVEERLTLIEQWIYDYKSPVNIYDVRF